MGPDLPVEARQRELHQALQQLGVGQDPALLARPVRDHDLTQPPRDSSLPLAGQGEQGQHRAEDPLVDLVSAVSVGMWRGQAVLDLDYPEDSSADSDVNVVMLGDTGFVEVQGTAESAVFSRDELNQMLSLADAARQSLLAAQREALSQA